MSFKHDLMHLAHQEARATLGAFADLDEPTTALAVGIATWLEGIETGLRAALLDPAAAEQFRDRMIDAIHRSPESDPRGEHHAAAAALRVLDLLR